MANNKKKPQKETSRNNARPNGKAWKKSHPRETHETLAEKAKEDRERTIRTKNEASRLKSIERASKKGRRRQGSREDR